MIVTLGGIIVGSQSHWRFYSPSGLVIATCWALCNLVMFGMTLLAISQRPRPRGEERFSIRIASRLTAKGKTHAARTIDVSLTGVLLESGENLEKGERVRLEIEGIGHFDGTVARTPPGRVAVRFGDISPSLHDKLVLALYASGRTNPPIELKPHRAFRQFLASSLRGTG